MINFHKRYVLCKAKEYQFSFPKPCFPKTLVAKKGHLTLNKVNLIQPKLDELGYFWGHFDVISLFQDSIYNTYNSHLPVNTFHVIRRMKSVRSPEVAPNTAVVIVVGPLVVRW